MTVYKVDSPPQQEIIYNTAKQAVDFIIEQNKRSFDTDLNSCMYHSKDGLKCVVGSLISDNCYDIFIEGLPAHDSEVWNLVASNPDINTLDSDHQQYFREVLSKMQHVHDATNVKEWPVTFDEILNNIKEGHIPF